MANWPSRHAKFDSPAYRWILLLAKKKTEGGWKTTRMAVQVNYFVSGRESESELGVAREPEVRVGVGVGTSLPRLRNHMHILMLASVYPFPLIYIIPFKLYGDCLKIRTARRNPTQTHKTRLRFLRACRAHMYFERHKSKDIAIEQATVRFFYAI